MLRDGWVLTRTRRLLVVRSVPRWSSSAGDGRCGGEARFGILDDVVRGHDVSGVSWRLRTILIASIGRNQQRVDTSVVWGTHSNNGVEFRHESKVLKKISILPIDSSFGHASWLSTCQFAAGLGWQAHGISLQVQYNVTKPKAQRTYCPTGPRSPIAWTRD